MSPLAVFSCFFKENCAERDKESDAKKAEARKIETEQAIASWLTNWRSPFQSCSELLFTYRCLSCQFVQEVSRPIDENLQLACAHQVKIPCGDRVGDHAEFQVHDVHAILGEVYTKTTFLKQCFVPLVTFCL